jgi:hypothetical protein
MPSTTALRNLTGVELDQCRVPTFGGASADVYRGSYLGAVVAIKVRRTCTSQSLAEKAKSDEVCRIIGAESRHRMN